MKLSQLLQSISSSNWVLPQDPEITEITLDSRKVVPGSLFLAVPGLQFFDGNQFISQALKQGAAAVIYDSTFDVQCLVSTARSPLINIKNLSSYLSKIAGFFYGEPSSKMKVIGITGTNGKTSCTYFLAEALAHCQIRCAIAGTIGHGFLPQLQVSRESNHLTTADAVSMQRHLAEFLLAGASHVAIEVSSHSLVQNRVNDIHFEIAVLTQLSRDHLDYHKNMEDYAKAKSKLFAFPNLKHAVLNFDDTLGQALIARYADQLSMVTYSAKGNKHPVLPSVVIKNVQTLDFGFNVHLETPWGAGEVSIPLLGEFNLSNVLAVLAILGLLGIPFDTMLEAVSQLKPVIGRMQKLGGHHQPTVIVDYAHTPDALEKALLSLKGHLRGKLWCIFGCGGDRDRGKRPEMANVSEHYADIIVVTSDNPRHEHPQEIINDILKGFTRPETVIVEENRAMAIAYAVHHAAPEDIILIAGKGHEMVQIIGDQRLPFSDQDEVLRCLM